MLKNLSLIGIISAILIFNLLRFVKLDTIPAGFHINELSSAVTVQCLTESGCDAQMHPWPLFGAMQYGQDKPPVYIYPAILWVKVFGSSVPSLRAYSVCVLLTGIGGLFLLARELFGADCALMVVLAASCSPWAWVGNRLAIESFFAPVFTIWGLYFFWRSTAWHNWAWAGFFLACAMYAYPPARLQIPLMLMTLIVFERGRRSAHWPSLVSMASVFVLALVPMIITYMHGGLNRRFASISIFNHDYLYVLGKSGNLWDIFTVFARNYVLHLSPDFLFFHGDASYMYSTRHSGIFSLLDIGALVLLIIFILSAYRRTGGPLAKHKRWLIFLAANFFIGIIPSALTNQGLPHALRICGSWPFMMLFTGLMWGQAVESFKGLWPAAALLGLLGGGLLMHQYFTVYPKESSREFSLWARRVAESIQTPEDWQKFLNVFHPQKYHCLYFMQHRLGMSCQAANKAWQSGHL